MSEFEDGKRKENGLPTKRELLDQAYNDGEVKKENFDYSNPYISRFKNPQTGQMMSNYDLYKSSADTPEEKLEFANVELESLKRDQGRLDPKSNKYVNSYGEQIKNITKHNGDIRKKALKVYQDAGYKADQSELNRFMFSKDWDSYKTKRDQKLKPFETIIDNIKKPLEVKPDATPVDPSITVDDILNARLKDIERAKIRADLNEATSKPFVPTAPAPEGIFTLSDKMNLCQK